jgi:hypothetical protein
MIDEYVRIMSALPRKQTSGPLSAINTHSVADKSFARGNFRHGWRTANGDLCRRQTALLYEVLQTFERLPPR